MILHNNNNNQGVFLELLVTTKNISKAFKTRFDVSLQGLLTPRAEMGSRAKAVKYFKVMKGGGATPKSQPLGRERER